MKKARHQDAAQCHAFFDTLTRNECAAVQHYILHCSTIKHTQALFTQMLKQCQNVFNSAWTSSSCESMATHSKHCTKRSIVSRFPKKEVHSTAVFEAWAPSTQIALAVWAQCTPWRTNCCNATYISSPKQARIKLQSRVVCTTVTAAALPASCVKAIAKLCCMQDVRKVCCNQQQ